MLHSRKFLLFFCPKFFFNAVYFKPLFNDVSTHRNVFYCSAGSSHHYFSWLEQHENPLTAVGWFLKHYSFWFNLSNFCSGIMKGRETLIRIRNGAEIGSIQYYQSQENSCQSFPGKHSHTVNATSKHQTPATPKHP